MNIFLEEYLKSDSSHEIANIINSDIGFNTTEERTEKTVISREKEIDTTTYERKFYAVITILENLDNDNNPKRINLLS